MLLGPMRRFSGNSNEVIWTVTWLHTLPREAKQLAALRNKHRRQWFGSLKVHASASQLLQLVHHVQQAKGEQAGAHSDGQEHTQVAQDRQAIVDLHRRAG